MAADGGKWRGRLFLGGQGERWEAKGEVCGGLTDLEENITETDEAQTDRQTNTKLKCTVKPKRPPGNCDGPTGMLDNDAVGC